MATLKNLDDLFVHTLCRVYDAELRLTTALPKMAEAAQSKVLKQAFTGHLKETEGHIQRIEHVFQMLERMPTANTDDALKGIVTVSDAVMGMTAANAVKDAALIAAAQEAEHDEIAAYGTLRTWAQVMNQPQAVELLERTLEEEKKADQTLTAIASDLNTQAAIATGAP